MANDLAAQELLRGSVETLDERIKSLDAVTLDDVRAVASDVVTSDKLALSAVGPVDDWAEFERTLNF